MLKLIESSYDKTTGVSTAVIQNQNETFFAQVQLHPDDKDVASSFAGCQFAELKAYKKFRKSEYNKALSELHYLENLYSQLSQLKNFESCKHTQVCQYLRKRIKIQKKRVKELHTLYTDVADNYLNVVDARLDTARKIPQLLELKQEYRKMMAAAAENDKE